jgi:hypothetical protein
MKEAGERRRRKVKVEMTRTREVMRDPDTPPLKFPGAQIRLDFKPGPVTVHNDIIL